MEAGRSPHGSLSHLAINRLLFPLHQDLHGLLSCQTLGLADLHVLQEDLASVDLRSCEGQVWPGKDELYNRPLQLRFEIFDNEVGFP